MKKKLGEIRVRIVNMRSANFTEIREGLEGQKYNFLKLSFCDKEEKITVPIGDNKEATWTTENLIDTYHNLEPQQINFINLKLFVLSSIIRGYGINLKFIVLLMLFTN